MKMVFIDNMRPGMVVAQDVFALDSGSIPLVAKNALLTDVIIEKLEQRGIRFIYIKEKSDRPPASRRAYASSGADKPPARQFYVPKPKPVIDVKLREDAIKSLDEVFTSISIGKEDVHASSVQIVKHLDKVVGQLVDSLQKDHSALVNINDLKSYDEYTFHHSLSVAVISIALGQYLGFDNKALHQIGMCSMMHDIGKTAIPIEIIHKTSRLDDEEFSLIKTHSPAGYDYLTKTVIGDEELCQGVLHHHEKTDGTGYPSGLQGDEIPLMSRIISVADVYDALTSNRPYRQPMQPADATEYIMGGVGTAFDYDIVSAFVKKMELYPVGSCIELSNGKLAIVLNNENQMRPVVRLATSGDILDLYRDRSCLSIVVNRLIPEAVAL